MQLDKNLRSKAGHYEIQGETIAKFEFFDHGFNPYSRYLDVDKVDMILRRREESAIQYLEVQIKYGRLYECGPKWQSALFDYTGWRFFKPDEFSQSHDRLYVAYVFEHPEGYRGDIFVFPAGEFDKLLNRAVMSETKAGIRAKVCIAHRRSEPWAKGWFLWKKWNFTTVNSDTAVEVTRFRRNFEFRIDAQSGATN